MEAGKRVGSKSQLPLERDARTTVPLGQPLRALPWQAGQPTLCLAGMKRYCCRSVSTVRYFTSTSTLTGFSRQARCSLATLLVMVAENSWVLRSLGITCTEAEQSAGILVNAGVCMVTRCLPSVPVKPEALLLIDLCTQPPCGPLILYILPHA